MGMNEEKRRELQQQIITIGNSMQEEETFLPRLHALGQDFNPAAAQILRQSNAEAAGVAVQEEPEEINVYPLWQIYDLPQPVIQQRNEEVTAAITAAAQQQAEAVQVERTAQGQPWQQEQPKFSFKKSKRDKQKAAIVRAKGCALGTAATYDIAQQLEEKTKRQETVSRTYAERFRQANADRSVLMSFCRGFQLGQDGQPLTEQDAQNKQLDDAFCMDYCSGSLHRRTPHLRRMVHDIFAIRLTADSLSEKNLRENAGQLAKWADMSAQMESIMNDPINAPYFERMEAGKKQELEQKLELLEKFSEAFHQAITLHLAGKDGTYHIYVTEEMLNALRNQYAPVEAAYQQTLKEAQQRAKQKEAVRKTLNKTPIFKKYSKTLDAIKKLPSAALDAAAGDYSQKMFSRGEILKRLKEHPSLWLTEEEKKSVSMDRSIVLMKEDDDAGNLHILRTLKAMDAFGTSIPDISMYLAAKHLLAPRIEKVLDCDIEAWKAMSDVELVSHMAELNELFIDGMFVVDKASLKHPYKKDKATGKPLTLKQEVMGQRKHEYDYKAGILRALAERARALAILAKASADGRFDSSDFTENERGHKLHSGEDAFCQERIRMSENLMQAVQEKYDNALKSEAEHNA